MWPFPARTECFVAALTPAAAQQQVERMGLALASGRMVTAEVRRLQQSPGPLPADLPVAAVSFDYPFDPPRRLRFPQSFGDLPAMDRGIDDTFDGIRRLGARLRARRLQTCSASRSSAPAWGRLSPSSPPPSSGRRPRLWRLRRVIAQQFIRRLDALRLLDTLAGLGPGPVDRIDHPGVHLQGAGDPRIGAMATSALHWM